VSSSSGGLQASIASRTANLATTTRSPVGSHAYYSSLAVTGLPLSSFRTKTAKFIDDRWSGRGDETSYWPAAGVGERVGVGDVVGDINPFAACSPACFAPVSATELALGL